MKPVLASIWRALRLPTSLQLRIMRAVNDEFLVGLTGIIFNKNGEVLIVKHTYRNLPWSLPGGYLKAREHPIEGLEREIEEETGFVVAIDEPLRIRTDRQEGRLDLCYIGTFIGGEFKQSDEVSAYGFFGLESLPAISRDQLLSIQEASEQRQKTLKKRNTLSEAKNRFIDKLRRLVKTD